MPPPAVGRGRSGVASDTGRYRNFDTLRLWAVVAVVLSHSFLIATGTEDGDLFKVLTGEVAGFYAVQVFFVPSGFLVTRSRFACDSSWDYARRRFLRVYPAYAVSVLLVFLLVPFLIDGVGAHLADERTWRNLLRTLAADSTRAKVPEFTYYDAPVGESLNPVYWTIEAEVLLYLLVGLLYALRLLTLPGCLFFLVLAIWVRLFAPFADDLHRWALQYGAPGFFSGAVMWFVFRHHRPRAWIAALLAVVTLAGIFLSDATRVLFPDFAAYPLLWLGSRGAPDLGNWTRAGDLSYGIYLFGWPVQQVIRSITGPMEGWSFFLLCLGPVLLAGWLSWHLIERPALRLKAGAGVTPPGRRAGETAGRRPS
ncbi:acyltransferase family protein [Mameliella alba]|uniref:Putative acyltransferase n=1 Tax=Mameliella alba TaxID=561184 RepID=A0A0B3RQQ8_9RHOB|nr:acyltransferase [Mameliella alba]KHQ50217.1 putative acyltransferase [Mameliella alba]